MPLNRALIDWSEKNYSYLPWRKNRSLYGTLVSEVMLQQTTVGTVLNHFERFISKYPTIRDLASLGEEQILIEWKGLGYYRRARNLLNAAKEIEKTYHGEIPLNFEKLKSIKGIGDYTANAILSIGANIPVLALDANLERVLSRLYGIEAIKGLKLQRKIQELFSAEEICHDIELYGGRNYNETLMDLGRSLCKARSSACELCPLSSHCVAHNKKSPLSYPRIEAKNMQEKMTGFELKLVRVIVKEGTKTLAYKKTQNEWLSNQFEVPTFVIATEDETFSQYPYSDNEHLSLLPSFRTGITKYKIDNYVVYMDRAEFEQEFGQMKRCEWIERESLLSTASMKAISMK